MPQSFHQLYAHIIFSTKHREPFMDASVRPNMQAYLATLCRDAGCPWVVVGGVEDHVHVAADLGKKLRSIDLIAHIKKESSSWIKKQGNAYHRFYWQDGYALFSFGAIQRDDVEQYIRNQEEHHRKKTFQEELLSFLKRYEIPYDERYIWD
ncbi:MAG: IS200/IS605 family transposase [Verrucomicrobia bacterium]|nr:IS200/IS605 family transposase [Verrucomicrobiota bacterium]MCH8512046.1 IS200/IS605 family transposase [Kiritimatiellia bacterium]